MGNELRLTEGQIKILQELQSAASTLNPDRPSIFFRPREVVGKRGTDNLRVLADIFARQHDEYQVTFEEERGRVKVERRPQ